MDFPLLGALLEELLLLAGVVWLVLMVVVMFVWPAYEVLRQRYPKR